MKKKLKKIVLFLVCFSVIFASLSSCAPMGNNAGNVDSVDGGNSGDNGGNKSQTSNHEVWSTYSTVKVTKNQKPETFVYYDKLDPAVEIEMMKGEVEGSQIVITADGDISSYYLTTADLKDGKGHTFSKSNISVYVQKYIYCPTDYDSRNANITKGDWVPDMLLPIEIAKEYGENKVSAGENQGITIEAETTSATYPGVYTGNFVLNIDGKKQNIPVSIEVWDIEYDAERSEYQSSFLIYETQLLQGEYESSDELANRYNEFLLKYNANGWIINKAQTSAKDIIEECESLAGDKNFNSLPICGYQLTGDYYLGSADAQGIINFIVETAQLSSPERPYVEMLYLYPLAFDEVGIDEARWNVFVSKFRKGGDWDQTRQIALERVKATAEYQAFDADFKARVDEAILNIPAIATGGYQGDSMLNTVTVAYCPNISQWDLLSSADRLKENADEMSNGNLWTYTCIGPVYPYPTFHITDYNLGTRIGGWISKQNHVKGYLYYMVNMYQCDGGNSYMYCDPYETANRLDTCPGDGYLLYPGKKYGSAYPFATNRLAAYRDSVDDYDMLTLYEHLLKQKAEKYGIEIDFNDYVNDIYDSLTEGAQYYTDDSLVLIARRELAKRILAVKGELGIFVKQTKENAVIYAGVQTLTINGERRNGSACGEGYKFEITNATGAEKSYNVTADGVSYEFTVYGARTVTFKNASASENSSASVVGSSATVEIVSVAKNNSGATERFRPYVELEVSDLSNAKNIQFTLENTCGEVFESNMYIILDDGTQLSLNSIYVKPYGTTDFRINLDKRIFTYDILKRIAKIRFTFDNTLNDGTATLLPNKTFTIDDVFVELGI